MTYKQKLTVITERLTTDRTLLDLAARLESNRRQREIDKAVDGVDFAKIELSTCKKDSNVLGMISDIEYAINMLNDSLIALNVVAGNDELVETLFNCIEKEMKAE